jgi:hypothetical protein
MRVWTFPPVHRSLPPVSLHSEGVPPIKFDPWDIYGVYPNNFGNMAAKDDATKEEVSSSRQGPIPARTTRSRYRSRSAPRARGRPAAPRAATKSTKVGQQSILAILNSAGSPTIPPAPPLFSTIAGGKNSPTTAPAPTALASAAVGMSAAVQKHKTNSLSLLCSSSGSGKKFETRLALLRKSNVSLMMEATAGVRTAGGTGFSLETLFEMHRRRKRRSEIFPWMDRLLLPRRILPRYSAQ